MSGKFAEVLPRRRSFLPQHLTEQNAPLCSGCKTCDVALTDSIHSGALGARQERARRKMELHRGGVAGTAPLESHNLPPLVGPATASPIAIVQRAACVAEATSAVRQSAD